jgi:uncharacterized protein (UPF0335 family)
MDRKTLEYMEERSKQARKIVHRIEKLKEESKKVQNADQVMFQSKQHGNYVDERSFELLEKMKIAFEKAAVEEIERLENALAEL